MHYAPLPVNVPYVSKPISQRFKGWMESAGQWIKSHPFITAALAAVFSGIIAPITVILFQLYVGNPFAKPDVTVDSDFGSAFSEQVVYPVVTVYNAGDATAESCHVIVTDAQTQKSFWGPTIFPVPSHRSHFEQLEFQAPKLPKGTTSDIRQYLFRAVCSNAVSKPGSTIMKIY